MSGNSNLPTRNFVPPNKSLPSPPLPKRMGRKKRREIKNGKLVTTLAPPIIPPRPISHYFGGKKSLKKRTKRKRHYKKKSKGTKKRKAKRTKKRRSQKRRKRKTRRR